MVQHDVNKVAGRDPDDSCIGSQKECILFTQLPKGKKGKNKHVVCPCLKFGITVTTRPDIVTRLNRMRRGNTRVVGILEGDDVIGRSFCAKKSNRPFTITASPPLFVKYLWQYKNVCL